MTTCACGTNTKDLPMFFITRDLSYADNEGRLVEEYEDHMFHRCSDCQQSFCSCGQQHAAKS